MLERILTVAMSFAIVCVFGCEGPEALTEKKEKSSIINQKTQDVTEFDADGDAKVADMQVKSKNPYGAAMQGYGCLLYTSPSPRDQRGSRMPSSA